MKLFMIFHNGTPVRQKDVFPELLAEFERTKQPQFLRVANELCYVWDDEAVAKLHASWLEEKSKSTERYQVAEFQQVCSKAEWN